MKVLVVAFSFLLLSLVMSDEKTDVILCCQKFVHHRIPQFLVIGYVRTGPWCLTPGIVFETKQGLKICANPAAHWVQRYIRNLNRFKTGEEQGDR